MARMPAWMWDVGLALGLFLLYLELKHEELIATEQQQWAQYQQQQQHAQAAAQATQHNDLLGGIGNFLSNLWDPFHGQAGVLSG